MATMYSLYFTDPGMVPKTIESLDDAGVSAALATEAVKRNYTRVTVMSAGNTIQVFERELGGNAWYAWRQSGALAYLATTTTPPAPDPC